MVIVVRRAGMPHARERLARGAVERIKKRARIARIKMPARSLHAIDL